MQPEAPNQANGQADCQWMEGRGEETGDDFTIGDISIQRREGRATVSEMPSCPL